MSKYAKFDVAISFSCIKALFDQWKALSKKRIVDKFETLTYRFQNSVYSGKLTLSFSYWYFCESLSCSALERASDINSCQHSRRELKHTPKVDSNLIPLLHTPKQKGNYKWMVSVSHFSRKYVVCFPGLGRRTTTLLGF